MALVQLPTVNTPQFSWVKSRLPHKAQPVPPIYQPEVVADAITSLSDHYRRQLYVGGSTVVVIQASELPLSLLFSGFFGSLSSPDSFPEMGIPFKRS